MVSTFKLKYIFFNFYHKMHANNLFICRRMKQQAKEMHNNVGFLDPQVFSATMLQFQAKDVTQTITKAMKHDFVVGAYNTGGHWIVVTIAIKWDVVLYLDSAKTWPKRKFKDVVTVVNL